MIPVVLLGGLNVLRTLGMRGIPVIVASLDRETPAGASRYCSGRISLPASGGGRQVIAEALAREGCRLAARYGRKVPLFYGNDDWLALVQDCRDVLEPHFALLLNEPAVGEALLDKARFQALAERRGLPVPRRIDWDELAHERGPVLVKPKTKIGWDASPVFERLLGGVGKARIFDSGGAARLNPLVHMLALQLAFQEYVPGDDRALWSYHAFAAPGGEVLQQFVGRKIRTYPALTGESSYIELAHSPELCAIGRDVAARLGLAGVFKMDFKRAADGSYRLLEINARCNLWNYLGAKNGVNLPFAAYEFLLYGKRPAPALADMRYRWLAFAHDLAAYRELRARGQLSTQRWLASLLQAPKVYELFAWDDPAPFLRFWRGRIERRLRRLWQPTAS